MLNDSKIIDNKYIIISKIGGGGFSLVFHVKDDETKEEYAAKVITKNSSIGNKEVEFSKLVNTFQNPYIIKFITNGCGTIQYKDKIFENQLYYIFEYASKGNLWNYILQGGFGEKYSKFIFSKILNGIQALHDNGICHRDIKPQNILLDDNFNPKICDFGFAESIKGNNGTIKFTIGLGTSMYMPPQMHLYKPYDGIKADIFSLGVTLFVLINKKPCFYKADVKNKIYKTIILKKGYEYYLKVNDIKVTKDFLDLFYKMVAFEEKDRPNNIQEILKDKWFKEIKDLNDDEIKILEDQIRLEFEKRKEMFDEKTKTEKNITLEKTNKEGNEKIKEYFKNNVNIRLIKDEIKMDNYIKINGNLNTIEFMNIFANKIEFYYSCHIEPSNENLTFNAIFKKEENEEEENEENDEEDEELDFDNIQQIDKELNIQVKLFKYENSDHYILRFIKEAGYLTDYYRYLLKFINLAKKLI